SCSTLSTLHQPIEFLSPPLPPHPNRDARLGTRWSGYCPECFNRGIQGSVSETYSNSETPSSADSPANRTMRLALRRTDRWQSSVSNVHDCHHHHLDC